MTCLANLKAEMKRHEITQATLADFLGMSLGNLHLKVNGKVEFTNTEMRVIQNEFFPDLSIDYLFSNSEFDLLSHKTEVTP